MADNTTKSKKPLDETLIRITRAHANPKQHGARTTDIYREAYEEEE